MLPACKAQEAFWKIAAVKINIFQENFCCGNHIFKTYAFDLYNFVKIELIYVLWLIIYIYVSFMFIILLIPLWPPLGNDVRHFFQVSFRFFEIPKKKRKMKKKNTKTNKHNRVFSSLSFIRLMQINGPVWTSWKS